MNVCVISLPVNHTLNIYQHLVCEETGLERVSGTVTLWGYFKALLTAQVAFWKQPNIIVSVFTLFLM